MTEQFVEARAVIALIDRRLDQIRSSEARTFRDKSFTVREIVLQQNEHLSYHAGQAAFLRRLVADLAPTP